MSAVLEVAAIALGLTEAQRQEIQTKTMMRSEQYKENRKVIGTGEAKRQFKAEVELETGEKRQQHRDFQLKGWNEVQKFDKMKDHLSLLFLNLSISFQPFNF